MDFLFCRRQAFTLHAIIHDAARAARSQGGKVLGFCYKIEPGPNLCMLVCVTRLLFCRCGKKILAANFNPVHF